MVRWWWCVALLAGCAGILDEDDSPPVALPTRDAAILDPQPDGGPLPDMSPPDSGAPDMAPDADGLPDAAPPLADMAPPAPDAAPPPVDMAPPPVDQGGCIEDVDCPGALICEDGACIEAPRCVDDSQCAGDERCEDGDCVPGRRPECEEDADCENDGRCIEGTCARGECMANTDCAVNERCEDQRCVPDLIQCEGPADCPMGEVCVDGQCAPIPPPDCLDDADCAPDERCLAGMCEPAPLDGCAMPIAIEVFGQIEGDTTDAVSAHGASCGGAMGPEQVYALQLPMAGPICVRTTAGAVDTVLYVREDDCAAFDAEVGCNDNGPMPGGLSELDTAIVADTPRWLFVDTVGGVGGAYTLSVTAGPCNPPPECMEAADCDAFERCVDGMCVPECEVDADCEPGWTCDANRCVEPPPGPGSCGDPLLLGAEPVMGMTEGMSALGGSCGGNGAPEVVFQYVALEAGPICVDTRGSAFDTVLYVREGDCDGMEIGCSDDGAFAGGLQSDVTIDAALGQLYTVVVDGFTNRSGAFTLTASSGACGAGQGGGCEDVVLALLGRNNGSTADAASAHVGGCGRSDGAPEVIHRLRVPQAGPICARTAGSDFDTVLYVRTACDDPDSEIACDDDVAVGVDSTSELTFQAEANVDYFVIVDGYVSLANGPQSGDYVLELSSGACP